VDRKTGGGVKRTILQSISLRADEHFHLPASRVAYPHSGNICRTHFLNMSSSYWESKPSSRKISFTMVSAGASQWASEYTFASTTIVMSRVESKAMKLEKPGRFPS